MWYLLGAGAVVPGVVGRSSRGGTHNRNALSRSMGSHNGGGRSWVGAAGRRRGGMVHPRSESASSAGLHNARAKEGEEMERGGGGGGGVQKLETGM